MSEKRNCLAQGSGPRGRIGPRATKPSFSRFTRSRSPKLTKEGGACDGAQLKHRKRYLCIIVFLCFAAFCLSLGKRAPNPSTRQNVYKPDLMTLREVLAFLENRERIAGPKNNVGNRAVTIVLNVFLRPNAFHRVLDGIGRQSARSSIARVIIIALGSPFVREYSELLEEYQSKANWTSKVPIALVSSGPAFNPGYYGRFLLSVNLDTEFTFILDDDIVLGERFLELCLRWSRCVDANAILGQRGARYFRTYPQKYLRWLRSSRISPNKYHDFLGDHALLRHADVLFSAWFLKTTWISRILHEEPLTWKTGEDIHLCMLLRQKFGIKSLAFPVDSQLLEYRLSRDSSIEMENRSWSDLDRTIVNLRDSIVDHWLTRESRDPATFLYHKFWTRKDMYWQCMPLSRGAIEMKTPQSRSTTTKLKAPTIRWHPFSCNRLRLCQKSSLPRILFPNCRTLRYRRPWIGIAKSYFGHWGGGFQADCIFWGIPTSSSYREHIGYFLELTGNGFAVVSGVFYGNTHARVRIWDMSRSKNLIEVEVRPGESFHLTDFKCELPSNLLFIFSESRQHRRIMRQRKIYDEIRIHLKAV